jgi:predicted nucleic acid-binding protein
VIAYLDASALVKRYVKEPWSGETLELTTSADVVATSLVSRAEVAAALAKAVRIKLLSDDDGRKARRAFARDWPDLARIAVTDAVVSRAEALVWDHELRGYDAVQLASALAWQESLGTPIVVATFDTQLWKAARDAGVQVWPENLDDGDETAPEPEVS